MPIWLELIVLCLTAYAIGLGLGWLVWARNGTDVETDQGEQG